MRPAQTTICVPGPFPPTPPNRVLCGVRGLRVEKPQELKSAIQAALAHTGPALVDVISARQELAMPPKTTLNQAYHFDMFTMKAVLDGRAIEFINLAQTNLSR
jgi:pyruvate dehydrogenase (quinone)